MQNGTLTGTCTAAVLSKYSKVILESKNILIDAHQQVTYVVNARLNMAKLRLAYKLGLAGAVSVWTAGVVCYHTRALDNSWLSSMRAVRFGRAAYAVSK